MNKRLNTLFFLLSLMLVFVAQGVSAQNVQLHYDFNRSRPVEKGQNQNYGDQVFTSTFEYFKPGEKGETFMFSDVDYRNTQDGGAGLFYWEISHKFYLNDSKLNLHVEYDDGFATFSPKKDGFDGQFPIRRAALLGIGKPFVFGDLFVHATVMYKYHPRANNHLDAQFTTVWIWPLFNGKVMFNGFADVWTEDKTFRGDALPNGDGKQLVFLTEPQIWYNVTDHFAVGGEVEISMNFAENNPSFLRDKINKWMVNPTVAVKYTF
ncbi:DUF5020 family protein [Persicobacter psychrovividus]|uniref:DUF5020 domain-containing protein n=1 Tax=Persicobacter psychrovividus TaxID=387638 RepID=A0ABM7VCJ1_9BACT|nr:DUF5020 domain-containing protein [Persicobacter psychrovividus]